MGNKATAGEKWNRKFITLKRVYQDISGSENRPPVSLLISSPPQNSKKVHIITIN
jgi:hypothetical protein